MRNRANSGRLTRMQEQQERSAEADRKPDSELVAEDFARTATGSRDLDSAIKKPREIGGPKGAEPTRFGDWERAGRCIDF